MGMSVDAYIKRTFQVNEYRMMSFNMKHLILLFTILILFHEIKGESRHCSERNKCSNKQKQLIPVCYCDSECFLYQDCCQEHYESVARDIIEDSNSSLHISETCRILTNDNLLITRRIGAFMIDRCRQMDMTCEVETGKLDSMIPVSNGGKTYINANCALCNQVSEFKYWKIAFILRDQVIKNLETGKITSDETIFNYVGKSNNGAIYYLHPPAGITPRFCPFDVRMKSHTLQERPNYQNTYYCNNTFYKNRDECLMEDCCTNMFGACISFELGLLPSSGGPDRTDDISPIHVIIEFNPQKTDGKQFLQQEESVIQDKKLALMDVQGYILIEMIEVYNRTLHIDDCIYAIMAFLHTTPFRLVVKFSRFSKTKLPGLEFQTIFFMYRSTTMLGLSEINRLFHTRYHIQCKDSYGNLSTYARVNTSSMHQNKELFMSYVDQHKITNSNKYAVTPRTASESCGNFSLTIDKSTPWKISVEAQCLEVKHTLITVSQGNGYHVLTIVSYLSAFICVEIVLSQI